MAKNLLAETMSRILLPKLYELELIEHRADRVQIGSNFPLRYKRKDINYLFELIEFQWMTNGRPWFVINFDRSELRPDAPFEWPYGLRFRARSNTGKFERWFGIGAVESIVRVRHAAAREIANANQRLTEIDAFFKGSELSPYLRQIIAVENERIKVL